MDPCSTRLRCHLKNRLRSLIKGLMPDLVRLSHDISAHPETALTEYRTRDILCDFLHAHGFRISTGIGGLKTSFSATFGTARHPALAYLAELDALPGIGHACGHNVNSVVSAGAAVALSRAGGPDAARIAVIGTPAEEIGYGKPVLIRHHVFEAYDAALMSHASTKRLGYRPMLALKKIRIRFKGRSAHAATYPEEGRDALSGLILSINNINGLRASFRPHMRANGIITGGGTAPNIIPDFAEAYYFIRAITMDELDELMGWIRRAVRGAAQATGTQAQIREEGYTQYPFRMNERLMKVYEQVLDTLHLQQTKTDLYQGIGSSDIGELSHVLPTIHTSTPIGTNAHIHTPAFRRLAVSTSADRGIAEGALVLAMIGRELIKKPALLRQIRQSQAD